MESFAFQVGKIWEKVKRWEESSNQEHIKEQQIPLFGQKIVIQRQNLSYKLFDIKYNN